MSAACASPGSNGGIHDAFRSRMRIDTDAPYERQHDERSLLSAGSFEEVYGVSPGSFVHVSFDDVLDIDTSDRAFSTTDIDMSDWQLMPSPSSPYNHPRSTSGESSGHHRHNAAQHVPRNYSFASSLSSAAQSAGPMFSPYTTTSPEDQFPSVPFLDTSQNQQAAMDPQAFMNMFVMPTSQPQTTNVSTTTAANYPARLRRPPGAGPPGRVAYNASTYALPDPWSAHRPARFPYVPDAGDPVWGPEYSLNPSYAPFQNPAVAGTAATEQSISPGTRDSPIGQQRWQAIPQNFNAINEQEYLDNNLLMAVSGAGGVGLERTSSFPHSLTSSDVGTTGQHPGFQDNIEGMPPQSMSITPPMHIKEEDQSSTTSRRKPRTNYSHPIRFEPYAPPADARPIPSQIGPRRVQNQKQRVGGRVLGTKFDTAKAEKIKERREDGACWACSLQRDECSGGAVCQRCQRRSTRPNADVSLACDRTKLQDLKDIFVPSILTAMYEEKAVENFARNQIGYWYKKPIIVPCKLIWGFEPMEIEMYEFVPRGDTIKHSVLAVDDFDKSKSDIAKMLSPPLGMSMVDRHDLHRFNEEIDDIVNNWLHIFVGRFYSKSEDEFAPRLLELMAEFCRSPAEETKFLRDVFRLLVVTYYLTHAVTIAESRREITLSQMQSYQPNLYTKHCGPKLANRQLKHLFSTLRDRLTDRVLKQLSQFLKSSKRHERWTAAFCAILGLAVAHEQSQQNIHLILATEVDEGSISYAEAKRRGESACEVIDERFDFITKLFRLKYHAKFNPLRDRAKPSMRERLGERAFDFIDAVASLVVQKGEFLRDRARERISCDNDIRYTGRLQASFLLSFWPPS